MASANKNVMYYVHIAIFLLILFGIGFLPPFAQITPMGMKVLGVFLGVIYGWCFIALDWPSLVALVALAIVGYDSGTNLLMSGWSFSVIPQIVLCFIFAEAISQTQLTDYISNKLLQFKLFQGKPYALFTGILFGTVLLNLSGSAYAAIFVMWAIVRNVAEKAGYEKRNMFSTVLVTSIIAVFMWTSYVFLFKPGTLMMVGFLKQGMPNVEIPFLNWTALWAVYVMLYVILWPLIIKYVFRLDFSAVAKIDLSELASKDVRITSKQKFGLGCLIVFISMMLLQQLLPQTWTITQILTRLGLSGCLLIIVSVMAAYQNANGEHFISLQGTAKGIQWNVMWLIIATEPIANAFNSEECGIMSSVMSVITPILTSVGPTIFLLVCVIVIGIYTQFNIYGDLHSNALPVVFTNRWKSISNVYWINYCYKCSFCNTGGELECSHDVWGVFGHYFQNLFTRIFTFCIFLTVVLSIRCATSATLIAICLICDRIEGNFIEVSF